LNVSKISIFQIVTVVLNKTAAFWSKNTLIFSPRLVICLSVCVCVCVEWREKLHINRGADTTT